MPDTPPRPRMRCGSLWGRVHYKTTDEKKPPWRGLVLRGRHRDERGGNVAPKRSSILSEPGGFDLGQESSARADLDEHGRAGGDRLLPEALQSIARVLLCGVTTVSYRCKAPVTEQPHQPYHRVGYRAG